MKDADDNLVLGRTRWRRFAALMVPALVGAGGMLFGMSNGALAVSFSVSGSAFKISAGEFEGVGYAQIGSVDKDIKGVQHPVQISGMKTATVKNLCQSVVSHTPFGNLTLNLTAGGGAPVTATNLVIDSEIIQGDVTFEKVEIGRDASTLDKGPVTGIAGTFGLQADRVMIKNVKQVAWATTAGTFTLNGFTSKLSFDGKECF